QRPAGRAQRTSAKRQAGLKHRRHLAVRLWSEPNCRWCTRDTAPMQELLDLARDVPPRVLEPGERLIAEGSEPAALFVLLSGGVRVEKGGALVAIIDEPGVCIGELSLLLDVRATADVVASAPTVVAAIDDARDVLATHPELALALARLLAT